MFGTRYVEGSAVEAFEERDVSGRNHRKSGPSSWAGCPAFWLTRGLLAMISLAMQLWSRRYRWVCIHIRPWNAKRSTRHDLWHPYQLYPLLVPICQQVAPRRWSNPTNPLFHPVLCPLFPTRSRHPVVLKMSNPRWEVCPRQDGV